MTRAGCAPWTPASGRPSSAVWCCGPSATAGWPCRGSPSTSAPGRSPTREGRIEGREREYVVGWIKRGPTGIIGTNRKDANETVRGLLADLASGAREDASIASAEEVEAWLSERCPDLVDLDGWEAIDAHERATGQDGGRPRRKLVDRTAFMDLVRERARTQ